MDQLGARRSGGGRPEIAILRSLNPGWTPPQKLTDLVDAAGRATPSPRPPPAATGTASSGWRPANPPSSPATRSRTCGILPRRSSRPATGRRPTRPMAMPWKPAKMPTCGWRRCRRRSPTATTALKALIGGSRPAPHRRAGSPFRRDPEGLRRQRRRSPDRGDHTGQAGRGAGPAGQGPFGRAE